MTDEEKTQLKEEAAATVQRWTDRRVELLRELKAAESKKSKLDEGLSFAELRSEFIAALKAFGVNVMSTHPWMKILVVQHDDPFTKSQRILVQATNILLMLIAITCCQQFRLEIGCSADTSTECRGHATCYELMLSEPFFCEGFACAPSEPHLPEGFACDAFPQSTLVDKIWMAVYALLVVFPLSAMFAAMFVAGGKYRVPSHWDSGMKRKVGKVVGNTSITFLENLVFIAYVLFIDSFMLGQHLARYFTAGFHLLDSIFLMLRRGLIAAHEGWKRLCNALHFIYHTRLLQRDPQYVFNEMQVKQRLKDESRHELARGDAIFDQARVEMDSFWAQLCYTVLVAFWAIVTWTLLVYGTSIRNLMGSSGEKAILQAWGFTLLVDILGMQVLKSFTIKIWIKVLIRKIKSMGKGEEHLALWYEGYMNSKLPLSYSSGICKDEDEFDECI
eukprot:gene3393-4271_t